MLKHLAQKVRLRKTFNLTIAFIDGSNISYISLNYSHKNEKPTVNRIQSYFSNLYLDSSKTIWTLIEQQNFVLLHLYKKVDYDFSED